MNQKQMNRAEMLATTRAYLDANTLVWSPIPIISGMKNELDTIIQKITEHQEAQEAAQIFLGKNKTALKRAAAEKADILNDILAAYATVEDNATLEQKANKSYSDLYKLKNQDFKTVIGETILLLEENLTSMADYGITEDQIEDLKTSFDNYLEISGEPRLYRVASSQATAALEDLFTEANQILTTKLDRMMKRFKSGNTNFYNGYLSARVVVDN
jgi:hypothetical protein